MKRFDIINYLTDKNSYKSYLEIGVYAVERTFNRVNIENKVGVDPKNLNA